MDDQSDLREKLLDYLDGGHAHKPLEEAAADFPMARINDKAEGTPYSFWQLLEHIRRTQFDILDFVRNPDYKERQWPEEYWPDRAEAADAAAWKATLDAYRSDLEALKAIAADPKTDLLEKIPHGQGQTIFREALLVIDHNAYHTGEFVLMRRALGIWPAE